MWLLSSNNSLNSNRLKSYLNFQTFHWIDKPYRSTMRPILWIVPLLNTFKYLVDCYSVFFCIFSLYNLLIQTERRRRRRRTKYNHRKRDSIFSDFLIIAQRRFAANDVILNADWLKFQVFYEFIYIFFCYFFFAIALYLIEQLLYRNV